MDSWSGQSYSYSPLKMPLKEFYIDRQNFGLGSLPYHKVITKWRLTDVIYIILILVLDEFFFEKIDPYQRQFTINDITISHPFAEVERVSASMLFKVISIGPLVIIFLFNLVLTPNKKKVYVFYLSIVGLLVSLGTCVFITDVLKNWIGRCRPDFLDRCQPSSDAVENVLYYAKDVCTTTDTDKLLDGFRTTPSGHSSMSFASFGYVSFWLFGQLLVKHIHGGAWRSVVAILPLVYAAYVALSRTQDYRHHFVDVILGSILGSLVAWWSYRRLFPSVDHPFCYVPYQLLDRDGDAVDQDSDFYTRHSDDATYSAADYSQDLEAQTPCAAPEQFQLRVAV